MGKKVFRSTIIHIIAYLFVLGLVWVIGSIGISFGEANIKATIDIAVAAQMSNSDFAIAQLQSQLALYKVLYIVFNSAMLGLLVFLEFRGFQVIKSMWEDL